VVTIDLAIDEQVCDCCQGQLHQMGETRSEKLEFLPAHIKVIETVRPKYTCKQCEKTGTGNQVKWPLCLQCLSQKVLQRRAC
jgi:transposase